MRSRTVARVVAVVAVLAVLAAACSSSAGTTTTNSGNKASATKVIANAQAIVTKAMKPVAASLQVAPVAVPAGKRVGVLVCGYAIAYCGQVQQPAIKAALSAAGLKGVFVDGKGTPEGQADAEQQLISDHVNAIINISVPDVAIQSAVRSAREADIPVLCLGCGNAANPVSDPAKNGSVANADSDQLSQGVALGSYLIVAKNGTPKVGVMSVPSAFANVNRVNGVKKAFQSCASLGCTVHTQVLSLNGDVQSNARNVATTFLQQYSSGQLNYIMTPSDDVALGVQQAMATLGRNNVLIAGYDCGAASLQWIRESKYQVVDVAAPLQEEAWAIVDQAIRVLAGKKGQTLTFSARLITKDNVGTGTAVCGSQSDYAPTYEKAWRKT